MQPRTVPVCVRVLPPEEKGDDDDEEDEDEDEEAEAEAEAEAGGGGGGASESNDTEAAVAAHPSSPSSAQSSVTQVIASMTERLQSAKQEYRAAHVELQLCKKQVSDTNILKKRAMNDIVSAYDKSKDAASRQPIDQ